VYANLFDTFADACLVSSIHRLNLLGRFDEVLVMRDGRLVAQGSADELALSCAEFRRLTNLGSHASRDQATSATSSMLDRASAG
jgi:ABC-type multidrug transport system fused ATPase/permease subunit